MKFSKSNKNQYKSSPKASGGHQKNTSQQQSAPDYQLIYGAHSIAEAIKCKKRKVYKVWTTESKAYERVKALLPDYTIIQVTTKDALDKMTEGKNHLGVVAAASPFQFQIAPFDSQRQKRLLMLDGVVDAKNMGAILRSAFCTGFTGICLIGKNNASINADTISASAGLAQHLAIKTFGSSATAISEIKANGYQLITSVVSGGQSPELINKNQPLCLVIGGEETGVGSNAIKEGLLISLTQWKADACFNASVAAGILMYLLN